MPTSPPTLDIFIEIRQGWQWIPLDTGRISEPVFTRAELMSVLNVYARWSSVITQGAHLRVTARGHWRGRWIAEYEWAGGRPAAEPLVYIPSWESLSLRAKIAIPRYTDHDEHRLVDTGETDVRTLRLAPVVDEPMPDNIPHVRDKEDVPHEGSLADLYGLLKRRRRNDRFNQ